MGGDDEMKRRDEETYNWQDGQTYWWINKRMENVKRRQKKNGVKYRQMENGQKNPWAENSDALMSREFITVR